MYMYMYMYMWKLSLGMYIYTELTCGSALFWLFKHLFESSQLLFSLVTWLLKNTLQHIQLWLHGGIVSTLLLVERSKKERFFLCVCLSL